ncbi:3-methyl-2-oxobutanoate hydroxymethyltransferase [Virgibacillus dakarensis]|uniref:3-methyl-2-oxobutanoate hydroxymethyltransferase n=1 Tax=Lentibacillus populi TaxID=1827502 RepID=A0A9W5X4D8_9BACI|nr:MULTISPECIES: 3-methyl-2-oxobutanoate hydroxymethyltransferase [Bacillaceae]MBT2214243.1 3-methyl-2-oxobutanoate hydroxymethyltransferase [Virgibacillus dakarensis]MTW85932.1 3-methyl-2-oxobutanoate hydroxymethyltransferase [Virgibacillus dakarensis]GGB33313.1 3-methyl-2-oxobutanoate hydroxymethyltransferase [Lentibacillus populi]
MLTRIDLQKMKQANEKMSMITAYDYPGAKLAQEAGIDMILVGDSLGMVMLGYDSTVQVTVADMIHHAKAVKRGADKTFVVVDMPFMSYHISLEDSLRNAQNIFQETNAQAIKIEGASPEILLLTKRLTDAGIPVVAHIGLTPQSVNVLGGFKVQGKDQETGVKLLEDARNLEEHGAIAVVLECVPMELAEIVTGKLGIPTIGIGAGPHCDGQVLVYHDIIQYGVDRLPKFVKSYADSNKTIKQAIRAYREDVKQQQFPTEQYSFKIKNKEFLPKG